MLLQVNKETTDRNNHVNASEELDKDNLDEAHKEEQESKKIERQEKSKRKNRTARRKKKRHASSDSQRFVEIRKAQICGANF